MKALSLSQLAQWCHGTLHGEDRIITAIGHDTRHVLADSLYIALRGARFDGHAFIEAALQHGAIAALVDTPPAFTMPHIVVANTQQALADIAAHMQRARTTRVFAITGSNGKTTVKALLQAILEQDAAHSGKTVHTTPGNRNNEIGLPLAVIAAPETADYAIYEMGAGQPGDIAQLTAVARPHYALVNNVAPAHLERLHSLLGVAQTKGAIYQALPENGVAVINADDAFSLWFAQHCVPKTCRTIRFALEHSADIYAEDIVLKADCSHFTLITPHGSAPVYLPLPGRHNLRNALAAAALAQALPIDLETIVHGLAQVQAVAGRQTTYILKNGAVVIDDSYNANPASLAAAIAVLANQSSTERWLVLGDMRELGTQARALHAEAGQRARAAGIHHLYAVGELSQAAVDAFGAGAQHFPDHAALISALNAALHPGVCCLVKGSRSSAMDIVVHALLQTGGLSHVA